MTTHNYIFFTSDPQFRDLPERTQATHKKEFFQALTNDSKVVTTTYAITGLKGTIQILLWFQADTIESIQDHLNMLMHTHLGRYLKITHTLFGMTRPSQYSAQGKMGDIDTYRKGGKYLIIYPFTKTKEWHMLDNKTRQKLMGGHIAIGKRHVTITQLLLYSYGIDDSEFIVSYETDDLSAFQSLVMELRTDKVRAYTLKDTPIFTCIYKTTKEIMNFL